MRRIGFIVGIIGYMACCAFLSWTVAGVVIQARQTPNPREQTLPKTPVWQFETCTTAQCVKDLLNRLPAASAETAKITFVDAMALGQRTNAIYAVYFKR